MTTPLEQTSQGDKAAATSGLPPGLGGELLSTYEAGQILVQADNARNKKLSASLNSILPQDVISFDNSTQSVTIKDVDPGENMVLKPDGTYSQTDANGTNRVDGTWKMNNGGVELDLPNVSTVASADGTYQDLKSWNGVLNNKNGAQTANGPEMNYGEKFTVTPQSDGSSQLSLAGDTYILNSDGKTGHVKGSNEQFTYQKVGGEYDISFDQGAKMAVGPTIGGGQSEVVTLPNDDAEKALPKGLKKLWDKTANQWTLAG
ncbi:MAG TPA: hypothetical protein V6C81_23680 [Planktothrix sp.]|jgi:hypothetical protein